MILLECINKQIKMKKNTACRRCTCLCGVLLAIFGFLLGFHFRPSYPKIHIESVAKTDSDTSYDVYDLEQSIRYDCQCVTLKFKPATPICIYPDNKDVFISRELRSRGTWEATEVLWMQNILKNDSYMGLIDIGTNIGVFSLTAAAMGHNVLSIEPWLENYRRFHKSVKLGHLEKRITLITNSLLNKRGSYSLVLNSNNQGNIRLKDATAEKQTNATKNRLSSKSVTMNDLVPLCKFKKAFMKMDIEGNEHKALAAADRLFDAIDISYIMMEWTFLNDYLLQSKPKEDFLYAKQMLRFLEERDYVPETLRHAPLNIYNMNKWPNLIVWRKKTAI